VVLQALKDALVGANNLTFVQPALARRRCFDRAPSILN
jgi:hypothetical protein